MTKIKKLGGALAVLLLAACATPTPPPPAKSHLDADDAPAARGTIPPPVQHSLALPPPKPAPKAETYSVVVNNIKVSELLFALARDARLNVDVHPGITGTVTLNAIDQTLPQLLNRIAKQTDLRWELDGPNLVVMPDTPFLRNYRVDYVNMNRDTKTSVNVISQVNSAVGGAAGGGAAGGGGGAGGNNSTTRIENSASNHFWDTLVQNIKDILRETDKVLPEGSSETVTEQSNQQQTSGTGAALAAVVNALTKSAAAAQAQPNIAASPNPASLQTTGATVIRRSTFREAASVIANAETGVLAVRATSKQHEKIQEFLTQVTSSARRQVLVEATVAEVQLSQNYQQGIDWSRIRLDGTGLKFAQTGTQVPAAGTGPSVFELAFAKTARGHFAASLKLLETFGNVRVLSSPKISVLNNQTAVLKVVDDEVYFLTDVTVTDATTTTPEKTRFDTKIHSVPIGFVMNVTPQISENDTVLLNIRPSISRKLGDIVVPNFNGVDVGNRVPKIRTRELESVIRVENGNIAVMGGLMEDSLDNATKGVPGLAEVPVFGALFSQRNDTTTKTELVIFLRPVIVREASIAGDYRGLRDLLPDREFFSSGPGPQYRFSPSSTETGSRP